MYNTENLAKNLPSLAIFLFSLYFPKFRTFFDDILSTNTRLEIPLVLIKPLLEYAFTRSMTILTETTEYYDNHDGDDRVL